MKIFGLSDFMLVDASTFLKLVFIDKKLWFPHPKKDASFRVYTWFGTGSLKAYDYFGLPWCVITEKQTGWIQSKLAANPGYVRDGLKHIGAINSPASMPILVDMRLVKIKDIIEELASEPSDDKQCTGYADGSVYLFGYGNVVLLDNNMYKSFEGYTGLCAIGTKRRGYFIIGMPNDNDPEVIEASEELWQGIICGPYGAHGLSAIGVYIDNSMTVHFSFYRWGEIEPILANIPSAIRLIDSWIIGDKVVAKPGTKGNRA